MLESLIRLLFPEQCGACGRTGSGACDVCFPREPPIRFTTSTLQVRALGIYDGALRRLVLALKTGRRDVAESFAQRVGGYVDGSAGLIPVPTTAARRRERGFDGCELIVKSVAQRVGAPAFAGLVQVAGDRQRGRNREARLAARGRFRWRADSLCGRSVILFDDVVTTGSTLEDCAEAVRAAGGNVRSALVIARANGPWGADGER